MSDRARSNLLARGARLAGLALLGAAALGCVATTTDIVPPAPPAPKPAAATVPGGVKLDALIAEVGYHERQVYEQQRSLSLSFACVPEEMWGEPEGGDPRSPVSLRGNGVDPPLLKSIRVTFAYFDDGIRSLEVLYSRFLDLRRFYDAARTDDELLRLVIQEGLSTLYQGRRLLDLQRGSRSRAARSRPCAAPSRPWPSSSRASARSSCPPCSSSTKRAPTPG